MSIKNRAVKAMLAKSEQRPRAAVRFLAKLRAWWKGTQGVQDAS